MDNHILRTIKGLKDPDQIFDLICVANYFAGNFDQKIPVNESREAFEVLKKIILKSRENK
jgi:hypothetical protein